MARRGQKRMHLPHSMQAFASMTGSENGPSCVMAFLGHTIIAGHLWFCGHRTLLIVIAILGFLLLFQKQI
jgi:hypothetical protein